MSVAESADFKDAESANDGFCNHPLLNSDLLTELCCHGIVAKDKTVSESACKITSLLLSCDQEWVWSTVWGVVSQWMPFIEVYTLSCVCIHFASCLHLYALVCTTTADLFRQCSML